MVKYEPPPRPDPEELDFSIFHPLDHRPFDEHCNEFYGGGFRHLRLYWWYFWKPAIRRNATCRLGLHVEGQVWDYENEATWVACAYCQIRLSEPQPIDEV